MESPPYYPGPPKKSKTGLIIGGIALAIVLCCCGVCGVGGYLGRGIFGKAMGMVGCSMSIEQQRDGLLGYAKAHGGKLPGAGTWQDDIKPYVKKMKGQNEPGQPFTIPGPTEDFCDSDANTSIVYNTAVAGKVADKVADPYETVALFERSGRGRNQSGAWKEEPYSTSPALVKDAHRGWIRQPLKGAASFRDRHGNLKPVPSSGNSNFGGVDVESKASSDSD